MRCDAPELSQFVEEALDPVAQAVEVAAEGMGRPGAAAVEYDEHRILGLDHCPDPFRVTGLVGEHEAIWRQAIVEQSSGKRAVVGLAGAQQKRSSRPLVSRGHARGAHHDHGMGLHRQSASRTTVIRRPTLIPLNHIDSPSCLADRRPIDVPINTFRRRSWSMPVAMSLQFCQPPRLRSPVQLSISACAGAHRSRRPKRLPDRCAASYVTV